MSMGTGSPDNVPEAFGAAGRISASRLIYADVGGQSPQAMVNELASAIRRGEIEVAVIVAPRQTAPRSARARQGLNSIGASLRTRRSTTGYPAFLSSVARNPARYYLNAARLFAVGKCTAVGPPNRSREDYLVRMAELGAAMSVKSLSRDHAQFAKAFHHQ